ncbi:helix-turn-helix transcriptional regulator [Bacillus sp. FJAT-42315]|uniref:helix-turn-helix transcriptional regulator n=1 Tax=Bacillus sp. FJAT-42315 TaxID=2014077 RepID=UPI000C232A3F|nr:helix-turn-helix domain-containing protein [Bacillus sp. FJAT-42315]
MEQTLKMTATLADSTRFSIYQYMIKHQKEVSVQDIAEQFDIHPNVARLHLSKLEDIEIVDSYLHKSGKGGRPGKLYKPSDKSVQLSFPHRDFQLLANIALSTLASIGELGMTEAKKVAYSFGEKTIRQKLNAQKVLSNEEKLQLLQEISAMTGYIPEVKEKEDGLHIHFTLYNCPFKEAIEQQSELTCQIHIAFLEGAFDSLFEQLSFQQTASMTEGCKDCTYHVIVTK